MWRSAKTVMQDLRVGRRTRRPPRQQAAEDEDNEDEVMFRAIAESLEYFDESQAKAASLAELAVGNPETGHLDGVGDAEDMEMHAAIRLSQVEY